MSALAQIAAAAVWFYCGWQWHAVFLQFKKRSDEGARRR